MLCIPNAVVDPTSTMFCIKRQLYAKKTNNATYHMTLKESPAQLVFYHDMIMPTTNLLMTES